MKNIHDVFHVFLLKLENDKNDETSLFLWVENEKQKKIKIIVDKKNQKRQNELFSEVTRVLAFEQRINESKWYEKCLKNHSKVFEHVFYKKR